MSTALLPGGVKLQTILDFGNVDRKNTCLCFHFVKKKKLTISVFEFWCVMVWYAGMYGQDQLRQRMAWALSEILVVTAREVDEEDTTEHFLKYYDIFVRHAFGNYRDVLKEVSFSPMMGEMLSYVDSEAFQFQDREIFPDENYAREIMQLFSIGLWKLNNDGTPVLDSQGQPIATYNNDEISKLFCFVLVSF